MDIVRIVKFQISLPILLGTTLEFSSMPLGHGQRSGVIGDRIPNIFDKQQFVGEVEFANFADSPALALDFNSPALNKTREALKAEWGKTAVTVGAGGSIPIVGDFKSVLGMDSYDPEFTWFGAAFSSFGILQNKRVQTLLGLPMARTWQDLANPALLGWVGAGDPRNSGTMNVMFEASHVSANSAFSARKP